MTIFVQNILSKMNKFGQKIRQLRTSKKIPLRKLAAFLDIDPSILSKIERGQRSASRKMALKTAIFFDIEPQLLLNEFFSDKIAHMIYAENDCETILKLAERKVEYLREK